MGFILLLFFLGLIGAFSWKLTKSREARAARSAAADHASQETGGHDQEAKKATEEKKEDKKETEGASLAGKIFGGVITLLIVGLTLYFLDSKGWLTIGTAKEHWFLSLLVVLGLAYIAYMCITRTSAAWAGLIVFLGVAYIAYLVSGGGNHQVANTAKGPIPAIVIPEVGTDAYGFTSMDVPSDGAWHAIVTPAGKRIGTFKCPADALMQVSGPNVPDPGNIATTDCDAGEQTRTLNLPEQAFWGAAVRFKAKFEDTKVRVKFVSK